MPSGLPPRVDHLLQRQAPRWRLRFWRAASLRRWLTDTARHLGRRGTP